MEDSKEFIEVQRFRQWWLLLLMLLIALLFPAIIVYQSVTHQSVGNHPASNTGLFIIFIVLILPLCLFFYFSKLTVKIDQDSIYYGFNFTSHTNLKWADIKNVAIIQYRFWGSGYKLSSRYGEIYNTQGNMGLQITKLNGGKILLGTQNPEALKKFLESMGKI